MKHLFLSLMCIFLLASCSKNQSVVNFGNVEKTDVDCLVTNQDTYVINSMQTLSSHYLNDGVQEDCPVFPLDYGWNTYSLLGQKVTLNMACMVNTRHKLTADDDSKTYTFTVFYELQEDCIETFEEMYWILAPKLPEGYTVNFEILEEE